MWKINNAPGVVNNNFNLIVLCACRRGLHLISKHLKTIKLIGEKKLVCSSLFNTHLSVSKLDEHSSCVSCIASWSSKRNFWCLSRGPQIFVQFWTKHNKVHMPIKWPPLRLGSSGTCGFMSTLPAVNKTEAIKMVFPECYKGSKHKFFSCNIFILPDKTIFITQLKWLPISIEVTVHLSCINHTWWFIIFWDSQDDTCIIKLIFYIIKKHPYTKLINFNVCIYISTSQPYWYIIIFFLVFTVAKF